MKTGSQLKTSGIRCPDDFWFILPYLETYTVVNDPKHAVADMLLALALNLEWYLRVGYAGR